MLSRTTIASTALLTIAAYASFNTAAAQNNRTVVDPGARFSVNRVAGLYQMIDGRGYADLDAAVYLRLLPDGRSRLEGVQVRDINGSITAETRIGNYARNPWTVRTPDTGAELCMDAVGKVKCEQLELDLATGDLLLYDPARPRGHADLRLHRIGKVQTLGSTD